MGIYTDSIMVNKTVDFILRSDMNSKADFRRQLKRIRNYQSQYEWGSVRYEFWKSVGDKLEKEIQS